MLEFEVLDHAESPIGVLILRRRNPPDDHVLELTLEHEFLMSSVVTFSERALATRAIEMHGGKDLDVMIGGLGLGYTGKAALDSDRVARVEIVELVGGIITWAERGLIPLGPELLADARCHVVQDDVYERMCRPPVKKHDVVLIDVDHSPDEHLGDHLHHRADDRESSESFYAHAGLALAKQHLEPRGVFGVWSTSPSPWFEAELRQTFDEVRIDSIDFDNETTGRSETNWLFLAR